MYFGDYLFSLRFTLVQDYFQYEFTRKTEEADGSVVLVELYVACFRECNNHQRLTPQGWPFSRSPNQAHSTKKTFYAKFDNCWAYSLRKINFKLRLTQLGVNFIEKKIIKYRSRVLMITASY